MSEILNFMGNHPFLTFFIVLLFCQCVSNIFGNRNTVIHKCDCDFEKESEDK